MYSNNDYRNYLAHHGVVGMHWGIRRFQPYSVRPRKGGKGGKEMGEAKHLSVGTRVAMHLRKKNNSKANKERLKASRSRTRLMKAIHTQRSKNYAEQGKYYDNKVKGIKQSRLGVKYHRLSGRTTTVGRKMISDSFTPATAVSVAKDVKYLMDKRKSKSSSASKTSKPRRSFEGRARRAYAKVFSLNEKTYNKLGNKTMAYMNKSAKNRQLKLADEADRRKNAKRRSN